MHNRHGHQERKIGRADRWLREVPHNHRPDARENEADPECGYPRAQGLVAYRPPSGEVPANDLARKVDEHSQSEVFAPQSLFYELEVCDGFIGLETNLADEVHDEEGLDVCSERSVVIK